MGTITESISSKKYGGLLAKALPKVIENDEELERFAALLEDLDMVQRDLTAEEETLAALLAQLIRDYDDRIELPDIPADKLLAFLMEQRGLKQADLVPLIGSRSQVSDMVTGKRSISKSQAKKLGEFFHVSAAIFI
jgi:HTH-type transcriptional regulator / antitoxin HigA